MKQRILTLAAAAALLVGCAGAPASSGAAPTAAPTASPTPAPTATPEPQQTVNPLTGIDTGPEYANHRPVAVTLRTGEGVTPYWGISSADLVIAGLSEGYDPMLVAVFARVEEVGKVGPVGPARDLGLQFTLPLNAVPVHIDKNTYASNLLNALTYQDVDGYHVGTAAFAFDTDRQASGYREENCWYTTGELISAGLDSYGLDASGQNMTMFHFAQRPAPAAQNAAELTIRYSASNAEQFFYNSSTGQYEKNDPDGQATIDADNGTRASFRNILILYASSGVKDDGVTRQYDLSGGTGLYLTDGAWQEIRWQKGDATAPLALTTTEGGTLDVNPGKTYLAIYGGHYGQSLLITDSGGAEQTLPERMPLLDSAVSDEAAAEAQQIQDASDALRAAQQEVTAAEQAVTDAAATEDTADDTAAAERLAAAQSARDEAQAAYDTLVPPTPTAAPTETPAEGETGTEGPTE